MSEVSVVSSHHIFLLIYFKSITDVFIPDFIAGNGANSTTFDLFESESGQDLTLSPQTFTSSTEAFLNDNSNSLGVPGADTDTGKADYT